MGQIDETRVVLADHPGIGRSALAMLVTHTPGLTLVGKVSNPEQIESTVRDAAPDVIVVDDRLLRDTRWTRTLGTRLIVVGVDDDPGYVARAKRIGAEAWIPKDRADVLLPLLLTEGVEPIGVSPSTH